MTRKTTAERTLLVKDREGEFKVALPEGAKLTFGPNVPYAGRNGYVAETKSGYALRVYVGTKENLIAVFANVEWFRDVTLDVARLVVREAGKSVWKSDEKGYRTETAVKRDRKWIDVKALNVAPAVTAAETDGEIEI
jgi:hypothetical protein